VTLADHLRELGGCPGDWLAVFGDVEIAGGLPIDEASLDRLAGEIVAAVGEEGHVLVPTFTLGADFNPATTPAATGRFAERFRRWPGVVRSRHPTHSVAVLGPHAHAIVADHDVYLPFRLETPLGQLVAHQGKVLLLGSDQRANALIHVARLSVERPRPALWFNVDTLLEFGGRRRRRYVEPPCDKPCSSLGPELESHGIARPFDTEWGRMTWMAARDLFDYVAALERENPERFLCPGDACRWCRTMRYLLKEA